MRLDDLFEEAKQRVLAKPSDLPARSALWQVLAARGELERARKQLDAMMAIDTGWSMEAISVQGLLKAEAERGKVFRGESAPLCVTDEPAWFQSLITGLGLLARADSATPEAAAAVLLQVQQDSDTRAGWVNGSAFEWLCDGDARFGPCLEVIAQGRYFWAPWSTISRISSRRPTEIRDRLWLHAQIEFGEEAAVECFLPARYPNPADDAHRLGERTDWTSLSAEVFVGSGQKTLITDNGEFGLLDIRELRFA